MGNLVSNRKTSKFEVPKAEEIRDAGALPLDQLFLGQNGLFTMKEKGMEPDLLTFLQEDAWLQQSDEELLTIGFRQTADNPYLENHHYFEGYFHGQKENHPIQSLNPRDGQKMEKPAAPARIRAFIQATQEKNQNILAKLPGCFHENSPMGNLFASGNALCDLAIQIRYGTGIVQDHLNWHVDTFNSMVHMGVALQGVRTLHVRRVEDDGKITKHSKPQVPGDIYLSSPAAFKHAVGHETLQRNDRIVAIQCRVLMTVEDYANVHKEFTEEPTKKREALDNIAKLLKEEVFSVPTLEEVKLTLEKLESSE
eukprot:GFUD01012227.1.p1 GENE.GFUD01012227.1~~GFUD01012227.1.p1  ORF type:complete len:310 (+),score=70.34 GFUD01012227.1:95-1024(+)